MIPKEETHYLKCNHYEPTYFNERLQIGTGVCLHCSMWEVQHPIWIRKQNKKKRQLPKDKK